MLTTSINKPVLLRFSHVKYRSHQTFLRINATWKVRVLNCDQIWVESVKAMLEVEVRSILPIQDAAEIAMAGSVLSQSDCCTPRLLLSVALLTRTQINATGKRPHENFSSGSYDGLGEEEQSCRQICLF